MREKRNMPRAWLGRMALGAVILCAAVTTGCDQSSKAGTALSSKAEANLPSDKASSNESSLAVISVKTIRPRIDPRFQISVEQPAIVKSYYRADIMARVAGPVKSITVDKGSHVKVGDVLVTIDVPDLEENVLQRAAVVLQRERELKLAHENVKTAEAGVAAARSLVKVKQADVLQADAVREFREKELVRYKGLIDGPNPAVNKDIFEERVQFTKSAQAAVASARAAVEKADADLLEYQSKLAAARADIELKEALVAVARKDKDYAQTMLGFATIRAPFNGEITQRQVDPGSFVRNATTADHASLLTLDRTDLVSVAMKVPDNYAPFVTRDTTATFEISSLPGVRITSKVTRLSGSLANPDHDRTMLIEVDLYNGTVDEYRNFLARENVTGGADLKDHVIPTFPVVSGKLPRTGALRLLPGTYGRMRLVLDKLDNAYLVPSSTIYSAGGNSYLFIVRNGKAVRVSVEVQVDDGKLAKVALIERVKGQQVRRALQPDDEVVATNQGELSDGQPLNPALEAW